MLSGYVEQFIPENIHIRFLLFFFLVLLKIRGKKSYD